MEDWFKEYADNRKALDERDVRELGRCLLGYIKSRLRSGVMYALDIPHIGVLHKKFNIDNLSYFNDSKETNLIDAMFLNKLLKPKSPSNKPPRFDNNEKQYLQDYTNAEED